MDKFRNLNKQQQINVIIGIAILAVIVAGLIVVWFTTTYSQYKEKDASLYGRLSGQRYEFQGDIKIVREKNDLLLTVKDSELQYYLDRVPVYSENESRALFVEPMGVVFVSDYVDLKKVATFSTVKDTIDGPQIVTPSGKIFNTENTFLYNGKDTYFFPNGATLVQGEREIKISPMSYVLAMSNYQLEIFDYKTGAYSIERITGEKFMAQIGKIQVDLEYDRVTDKEGEEAILTPQIEKLSDIEQ